MGIVRPRGKESSATRPAKLESDTKAAFLFWMGLPESIDTASMAAEFVDDVQVINPGSIAIKVPGSGLVCSPPKQTMMYGILHHSKNFSVNSVS